MPAEQGRHETPASATFQVSGIVGDGDQFAELAAGLAAGALRDGRRRLCRDLLRACAGCGAWAATRPERVQAVPNLSAAAGRPIVTLRASAVFGSGWPAWSARFSLRQGRSHRAVVFSGIAVGSERRAVRSRPGICCSHGRCQSGADGRRSSRLIPLRSWRRLTTPRSPISRGGTCLVGR